MQANGGLACEVSERSLGVLRDPFGPLVGCFSPRVYGIWLATAEESAVIDKRAPPLR